jgi:parallel beta-helix repeat protein
MVLSATFPVSTSVQSQYTKITQTNDFSLSQYLTSSPINITSNSDFVAWSASGVGSRTDPYVIRDLAISSNDTCISVQNTTAFFIIFNCILKTANGRLAIYFDNVVNGQVIQCEIIYSGDGIIITNSRDCTVSNSSIISSAAIGITIRESSNCTITNSRFYDNGWGLRFMSSSYCRIINNSIYSNRYIGIDFTGSSHNNTMYGNSIGWNNAYRGIEQNAGDWGEDNYFDDGVSIGNAWTDFNGTAPYGIQGSSGSIDSFPELLEDTENPLVFGLMDTVFDIETSGNTLTWTAFDEFPTTYSIQIDERDPDEGGYWNGESITIDLGTILVTGTYRYNLTVYDVAGNTASDEVIVTVVSFIFGGIRTELVMVASGFTVVIFLVIILIIKRLS